MRVGATEHWRQMTQIPCIQLPYSTCVCVHVHVCALGKRVCCVHTMHVAFVCVFVCVCVCECLCVCVCVVNASAAFSRINRFIRIPFLTRNINNLINFFLPCSCPTLQTHTHIHTFFTDTLTHTRTHTMGLLTVSLRVLRCCHLTTSSVFLSPSLLPPPFPPLLFPHSSPFPSLLTSSQITHPSAPSSPPSSALSSYHESSTHPSLPSCPSASPPLLPRSPPPSPLSLQ